MESPSGQRLPSNLDAERALLGAILRDESRTAIELVRKELGARAFYLQEHRHIFNALLETDGDHGRAVELLEVSGLLEGAGGAEYVTELHAMVHLSEDIRESAELIRDAWRRRELIMLAGNAASMAMDNDQPTWLTVDYLREHLGSEAWPSTANRGA